MFYSQSCGHKKSRNIYWNRRTYGWIWSVRCQTIRQPPFGLIPLFIIKCIFMISQGCGQQIYSPCWIRKWGLTPNYLSRHGWLVWIHGQNPWSSSHGPATWASAEAFRGEFHLEDYVRAISEPPQNGSYWPGLKPYIPPPFSYYEYKFFVVFLYSGD